MRFKGLKGLLPLLLLAGEASAQTPTEGLQAYRQNRIADARRIYGQVLANPAATPQDRADAAQELARIHWLVDSDADRALTLLRRAEASGATGSIACYTGVLTTRILREAERRDQAIARAQGFIDRCDVPTSQDSIRLNVVDAALDLAARQPASRARHLQTATGELGRLQRDAAAGLRSSRARMELGLLSGDGDAALRAWRDYFWLADRDAPELLAKYEVARLFREGAAPSASVEQRVALLELLMRAGFARPARHFVAVTGVAARAGGNATWRRVSAYLEQRERLETVFKEINRGIARRGRDAAYLDQVQERMERDVRQIGVALLVAAGVDPAAVKPDQFYAALLEHYGLFGTGPGRTSGWPSLHLGHAIGDRGSQTEVYGQRADVRLVELDNMIENAFEGWLWDGAGATGGWAAGKTIVGIRSGYTSEPMNLFATYREGPARSELIANQTARAQEDIERLRATPTTYLRGLDDRLILQAADRIAAVAWTRKGASDDLRRAFLDEAYRSSWHRSFDLHEARHITDYALKVDDSAETVKSTGLEYRAKLTEVALTDYPRLALAGLNAPNVGEATGHGQGNHMVLDLFRRWIEEHPGEVIGYDANVPALAQLDKLTDEQMRAIARAADPLATPQTAPRTQP